MNWRPKDWGNPYTYMTGETINGWDVQSNAFERGADTMLEALKKDGKPVPPHGSIALYNKIAGTWAFIPDEEVN